MKKKLNYKKIIIVLMTIIFTFILFVFIKNHSVVKYEIDSRINKLKGFKNNNTKYDIDGWIKIPGTNIDYPVIYDGYNIDIRKVDFDFLWKREKLNNPSFRTVIFGHNIKNVSSNPLITNKNHTRFEQLLSFIYYDFAKENQFIQYTKDNKEYLYQIFSVTLIKDVDLSQTELLNKKELDKYIKDSIESSFFKYDLDVNSSNKIITLLTCTRFYGGNTSYRFKIDGKLLDKNYGKNVDVVVNDNYEKIEKIMKDGDLDETKI